MSGCINAVVSNEKDTRSKLMYHGHWPQEAPLARLCIFSLSAGDQQSDLPPLDQTRTCELSKAQ